MIPPIILSGGGGYVGASGSAASGVRSNMTPDQAFVLMICMVGIITFLTIAVLDILKWREDERKRKSKGGK